MNESIRNWIAQGSAWLAVVIGGLSFEMWLGLAGLAISAFMAVTNYRHRRLETRLAAERAKREEEAAARTAEIHTLQVMRLRAGLPMPRELCGAGDEQG
ncbi:MAG: hypothetical protein RBS05_12545 [Zoogloea oleivorans]|jgi:hypothetical protein|uniref:hypothetical protein n=1 Tax=Zoogloea oleivorans TaxID=1552750 RepID=UPI002A35897E|nr:hypothetical protein [Zoogloea oleivorans]MDY0036730.1 hypothetical protein [Zoogloea oleivorans]